MPLLKMGSVGDSVAQLQSFLNLLPTRLALLKVDKIFGPRTRGRVVEFQGGNGLSPDGIVGDITMGVLEDILRALGLLPGPNPNPAPSAVRPINQEILGLTGADNLFEQVLPARQMVDMSTFLRNTPGNQFRMRFMATSACRVGLFAAKKGTMERVVILALPLNARPDRMCIAITQGFGQAAKVLNKLGWQNPLSKPFVEFALLKHVVNRYAPQVMAATKNMGLVYILRAGQGTHELGPFAKDGDFTRQVMNELVALTKGAFAFDAVEAFTYSSGISDFNIFMASIAGKMNVAGTYNIDPAHAAEATSGGGFRLQFLSGQTGGPRAGFEFMPHPRWRNEGLFKANEPDQFSYLHNHAMPMYCLNIGINLT